MNSTPSRYMEIYSFNRVSVAVVSGTKKPVLGSIETRDWEMRLLLCLSHKNI